MRRKLSYLVYFVLMLALVGTPVATGQTVWEGKIADNQDSVEQPAGPTGTPNFGSSDLEFMQIGTVQTIGLRFLNVRVPAGATMWGSPAREKALQMRIEAVLSRLPEMQRELRRLKKKSG